MASTKEEFEQLLRSTHREGVENVLARIESLGFFIAPASTRFHLNHDGGLAEHSLNVCYAALDVREAMVKRNPPLAGALPVESVIIASLLHDVCKSDIYRPTTKRQKSDNGVWVDVPGYDVDYSNFPLGHGEKSVIMLLQSGLKMTNDEIMAIRWHMNAWELPLHSADAKGNYGKAKDICPLLTLISAADGLASGLLED